MILHSGISIAWSSAPQHSLVLALCLLHLHHLLSPHMPHPTTDPPAAGGTMGTHRAVAIRQLRAPCCGAGAGSILLQMNGLGSDQWDEAHSCLVGMHPALRMCNGVMPPFPCSHVGWGEHRFGKGGIAVSILPSLCSPPRSPQSIPKHPRTSWQAPTREIHIKLLNTPRLKFIACNRQTNYGTI